MIEIRTVGKVQMFGTRLMKTAVPVPKAMLTDSVIGAQYMLKIQTQGVQDSKEVLNLLNTKLKEKFDITTYYGEVSNGVITLQISGSPFVWALVLAFIPQILTTIGIIIGLITAYLLVSSIPSWVYALGALSIILLFGIPKILPNLGGKK